MLELFALNSFSFFTQDIDKKQTKFNDLFTKIEQRRTAFGHYKDSIIKKSAILGIAKDFKTKNDSKEESKTEEFQNMSKKKAEKKQKIKKAK